MKNKICGLLILVVLMACAMSLVSLRAQPAPADASGSVLLSSDDLDQLVAPIALYPDPLIALILPASTVPTDIVLASRFLNNGGSADDIDSQPWDSNVKGLARYPDVLQMMDDNLDWTNQLGAAVLAQQADVMTAIQAQRAKAQSLGNLQTTPQQQVITDQQVIQIVPADPKVIYVPVYDPQVVYVQAAPPAAPLISFGLGLAVGAWLAGDCDWHGHGIYYGGYYRPGYGWGYNNVVINNNYYWRPNPNRPPPRPPYRPGHPGGNLPGWRPPPNWGKPGKPGGPGNRPGGNRPGIPGTPGNPGKPERPENRPGGPGNRPGHPSIQPAPGHPKPGETRPAKPTTPGHRPGHENQRPETKPIHTQPVKPKPERPETRPAPQPKPHPKPEPSRPATRPSTQPAHQSFNRDRSSTKPQTTHPQPQQRAQPRAQGNGRQNN